MREHDQERWLPADPAFVLQVTAKGLAGDRVMTRAALQALASAPPCASTSKPVTFMISVYVNEGDLRDAVQQIGIATLLDGYRPTARLGFKIWALEEALARLGDQWLLEPSRRWWWRQRGCHKKSVGLTRGQDSGLGTAWICRSATCL